MTKKQLQQELDWNLPLNETSYWHKDKRNVSLSAAELQLVMDGLRDKQNTVQRKCDWKPSKAEQQTIDEAEHVHSKICAKWVEILIANGETC